MNNNLMEELHKMEVPFVELDNNRLQIGYGIKSMVVSKGELSKECIQDKILQGVVSGKVGSIPIFAVTGSNGKTTTARLIYHLLKGLGYTTSLAYTGGIIIGDKTIREGDTTGFLSAREILTNSKVEAAVLETARGGIISRGLGYKNATAGIITTLSEDHLGIDGVNTLEDLVKVKAAVIKEVSRDGKIVIKAQKELVEAAGSEHFKRIILFSIDENHYIRQHVKIGGEALYLKNKALIHISNNEERLLADISELSFAYGGASRSNILNIMASIGAVSTIFKDYKRLVDIIKNLKCDLKDNSGRQNIIELNNFKVILDYGHNPEAYEEVFFLVKRLKPTKVTTSIICPGDRTDEHIRKLGYIAGLNSDYLILREPEHPRGRVKEEILKLFQQGARASGLKSSQIYTAGNEIEALKLALKNASKGEIIVMFVEKTEKILSEIYSYIR